MPKGDLVELDGTIVNALGGGQYEIQINEQENVVRGQLSGRLKRNYIRVVPGDRVRVAVSPYDMSHGLITFRLK
jgi:translation initiation factor IF-1